MVVHHLEHGGDQIARIQHNGLARLQINLHLVFFLQIINAVHQRFHIIIRTGDVVAAAEVDPFQAVHILTEILLKCSDSPHQIVRILLAERVEVEAFNAVEQLRLEILYRNAETRIRTARVIHRVVARLRGALRIEPQTAALPCRTGKAAVGLPLRERVEHNVVGVLQNLAELALRVGRRVDMGLAAEFLMTEPCLVQTGGRCARQILPNQRVHGKHRERLLRQQDLRAGASGNVPQDGQILHQTVFIEQVAGRRKLSKFHISPPAPACR